MAIAVNRHWILLALIVGAVVSYSVGFMAGLGVFIAAGAVLEFTFLVGLLRRRRRRRYGNR